MTTFDIIIQIFCLVDDEMKDLRKHSQAKLYPSEVVTIGILFALKGGHFRAFYRWLHRDYNDLFPACLIAPASSDCWKRIKGGATSCWLIRVSSR